MNKFIAFSLLLSIMPLQAMEEAPLVQIAADQMLSSINEGFRVLTEAIAFSDAQQFTAQLELIKRSVSATDLLNAQKQAQAQVYSHAKKRFIVPAILATGVCYGAGAGAWGFFDHDLGHMNSGFPLTALSASQLIDLLACSLQPKALTKATIIHESLTHMINGDAESPASVSCLEEAIDQGNASLFIKHLSTLNILDFAKKATLHGRVINRYNLYKRISHILPVLLGAECTTGIGTLLAGGFLNDRKMIINGEGTILHALISGIVAKCLELTPRKLVHYELIKELFERDESINPLFADVDPD